MTTDKNNREKNIKTVVGLNVAFTIIEIVGGLWTNSLAILSDALHDFGDSTALIISWLAERKAKQAPDAKRTYGYQRVSLLAAFFSALVLIIGSIVILVQAFPRIVSPEHVNAGGMIYLALGGIFFNGIGYLKIKRGKSTNEKVLSWHLLEDVLGWGAILLGAGIMKIWDIHVIDPILTIGFTLFIFWGVFKNLREALNIFLQGVPENINIAKIKESLLVIDGVRRIHDIHIWSLDGETNIFTGHVVVNKPLLTNSDETKKKIKNILLNLDIEHTTIELESEHFCSGVECER